MKMEKLEKQNNQNIPKLRFPEFGGKWKLSNIGSIANISSGGTPSRNNSSYWNGDIPWITTSLIDFNTIEKSDEYITQEGLDNSSAKLFVEETILMAMYGQGKTRGKVGVLKINAATNQACAAIKPNDDIDYIFLFQYLSDQYENIRKISNEGGQKNLSGALIKNIHINYPLKQEQQKIANFLTAIDKRIEKLEEKKSLLENYKKGVMQQIFSQKIRFKDDGGNYYPDWEEKKLGDVCSIKKGDQLNKEYLVEDDLYPALNGGIEPSGYTNKYNTDKNTITISEGGNSCGYINFMKTKFWSGGHCYSLKNIVENINNLFLYQILKFKENRIMLLRVGSGLPNIQKRDLDSFKFNFPSLQEQQKIANFLTTFDKKIENIQAQIEESKAFKKGLLQQMFV
jgi:type I restriction enzyme S subunit